MGELQNCGFVGAEDKRDEEIIDEFVAFVHKLHVAAADGLVSDDSVLLQPTPNRQQNHFGRPPPTSNDKQQSLTQILLLNFPKLVVAQVTVNKMHNHLPVT